jgi:hypothetical protein
VPITLHLATLGAEDVDMTLHRDAHSRRDRAVSVPFGSREAKAGLGTLMTPRSPLARVQDQSSWPCPFGSLAHAKGRLERMDTHENFSRPEHLVPSTL